MSAITQAELRRVLHYDADTGVFTWKYNPNRGSDWNTRRSGTRAGSRHPSKDGRRTYRRIQFIAGRFYEHRLVWLWTHGEWPKKGMDVDHRNGDGCDNRASNLRVVTRSENMANRVRPQKNNRSGHTGVGWSPENMKWRVQIQVASKNRHVGLFSTKAAAIAARRQAERQHFPEVFA